MSDLSLDSQSDIFFVTLTCISDGAGDFMGAAGKGKRVSIDCLSDHLRLFCSEISHCFLLDCFFSERFFFSGVRSSSRAVGHNIFLWQMQGDRFCYICGSPEHLARDCLENPELAHPPHPGMFGAGTESPLFFPLFAVKRRIF